MGVIRPNRPSKWRFRSPQFTEFVINPDAERDEDPKHDQGPSAIHGPGGWFNVEGLSAEVGYVP